MKAVLILNMPNKCFNCPLHESLDAEEGEHEFMMFCNAEHWRESVTNTPIENLEERPSWCPLRPLPKKIEVKVEKIEDIMHTEFQTMDVITDKFIADIRFETDKLVALGYNTCLDEISGETE